MLPALLPKCAAVRHPLRRRLRPTVRAVVLAAVPALALHGLVLGSLPLGNAQAARPDPARLSIRTLVAEAASVPDAPAADRRLAPVAGVDEKSDGLPAALRPAPPAGRRVPAAQPEMVAAAQADAFHAEGAQATPVTAADPAAPAAASVPEDSVSAPTGDEDPAPDREAASAASPQPLDAEAAEPPLLLAAAAPDRSAAVSNAAPVPAAEGDDPPVDAASVPVYKTSIPPSQTLRYNLKRGMLSGNGELRWQRDPPTQPGAKYELQLDARIGSMVLLTQVSSGGFDSAGLAPVRFTDRRLRSSARAANFQRQRSLVTFSGPSVEYLLLRGTQDRLSWMIQLPAILTASPRLAASGEKVTLYVIGSRGDAALWDFRYVARERLSTDAGPVDAVKFVREPRKPHDTTAEVWLDPSHHYLPVRARIGNPEEGPMLELVRVGA